MTIIAFTILVFLFFRSGRREIAMFFLPVTIVVTLIPCVINMIPAGSLVNVKGVMVLMIAGASFIGFIHVYYGREFGFSQDVRMTRPVR